jgi:hypothetical protein
VLRCAVDFMPFRTGLPIHSDSLQNSSVVPIAEHFVALDCMHADDVGASFCHAMRNLQFFFEA